MVWLFALKAFDELYLKGKRIMEALVKKTIYTPYGDKTVEVRVQDLLDLQEHLDVMTISSFYRGYRPSKGTLLGALNQVNISVEKESADPYIDLRESSNIWLSRELDRAGLPITRIGCVEMSPLDYEQDYSTEAEREIIQVIKAYFRMLDLASLSGIKIETVGLPILGGGNQQISQNLVTIPVLNEIKDFLQRNEQIRRVIVLTNNQKQAFDFATQMNNSYTLAKEAGQKRLFIQQDEKKPRAFISYSSIDRNIADHLCAKLENAGIPVWYAPRNIIGSDYAGAIVRGIMDARYFIVILSENSLKSQHVLNEVALAFDGINRGMKFFPLRINEEELGPSFLYYLSRQHYLDAQSPPLEKELDLLVEHVLQAENE